MAPQPIHPVTVLEQCHVSPSPAPAAGQPRALPLTFFDLVFWGLPPVQRLFFYDNAGLIDASDFTLRELPRFKKSLAAALHHFYPLAGTLTCEMADGVAPEIVFSDGDSVPLTVAVSGDDFQDLAGDHARDTTRLHPLLPTLAAGSRSRQGVLAVQVTVFPRAGVCIGTTLHHAVADGASYAHFLKTWAAIHRLLVGGAGCNKKLAAAVAMDDDAAPPLLDRGVVRDDAGLREAFLRDHRALAAAGDTRLDDWDLSRRPDGVVLATFRFTDRQLRALGRHVESETSARCSPYALACGAAWAGIVHARGGGMNGGSLAASHAHFGFVTGCKPRASPPIPAGYFGNCLGLCRVEARARGLTAAAASAAIWRVIEGLAEEGRAFRDARRWVRSVREHASARGVTVAGSPKLRLYAAADFGGAWGRPRKVEIASVERTGALALAESGRDGEGGIEVGLALLPAEMEAFRAFYHDLLATIRSSTVRLLDEQKRMVGVVSVSEAVRIADDSDLILAILSLDGDPPVLRLFEEKDYKKHRYEQQKKKKIQQKRSVAKRMGLKELKMGYNIDVHDYSVRLKAARKFLKAGDKVKIIVNLKGRENLYKKEAIELLRRFQTDVGELATEESKNFAERNIYLVLVPNKIAIQKEQDELNKKDTVKEERDQSDSDEPLTEQLEESKEPEAEVSASV